MEDIIKFSEMDNSELNENYNKVNENANAVEIANELVTAGVIKDEYTDLSGVKASSKLCFIISDIINKK